MATTGTNRVDWQLIWAQRGFRYFFVAMFVSLFGSGMNFAGVSWYILAATHSTVKVSGQVIVMTLPGLFVPFLGGVLIDRIDRRYLGVLLDLTRGVFVLATAYIAWRGHLELWHLYAMTLITGTGSAMYCATGTSHPGKVKSIRGNITKRRRQPPRRWRREKTRRSRKRGFRWPFTRT